MSYIPFHITFNLMSGKSIDCYSSGNDSAGANLPCEKLGNAGATSPDSFVLTENDVITDVFFDENLGAIELIKNGQNTGRIFRAAQCLASQAGRMHFNIGLIAGVQYRFKVVSAIVNESA